LTDEKLYKKEDIAEVLKLQPTDSFVKFLNSILSKFKNRKNHNKLLQQFYGKTNAHWEEYFHPRKAQKIVFLMLIALFIFLNVWLHSWKTAKINQVLRRYRIYIAIYTLVLHYNNNRPIGTCLYDPARRDGMLTEIPLVIQILKSVYMIPSLIPPRRDLGNRCRGFRLNEMKNSHINTPSRLSRGEKFPYKHFILARRDEHFPFEHAKMPLLQQKYDVKHLNGFIPAIYFVHIDTRRVFRLGGMKTFRHINRPYESLCPPGC
jgi:hypothetical protein